MAFIESMRLVLKAVPSVLMAFSSEAPASVAVSSTPHLPEVRGDSMREMVGADLTPNLRDYRVADIQH
jgi:hypothetical protein